MEKLLWIDLEMTGLDVEKEVIIEVGAIVTNLELKPQDKYHAVVKQPQSYLDNMDNWNQTHHKESGLVDLVPSGKAPTTVENELLEFIDKNFGQEPPVIAGNSISQDRLFIKKYFQKLEQKLHYRMLDVSSWKLIFKNKYGITYPKKTAHRATDDIEESIAELQHYLSYIKV